MYKKGSDFMDTDNAAQGKHQPDVPPFHVIDVLKKLEVCDLNCLDKTQCNHLHICPQYFYSSSCKYYSESEGNRCRFGHDLDTKHNQSILRGFGLDELNINDLSWRLKLLNKHFETIRVCEQYLKRNESHQADGCLALHICHQYLFGSCDGSCYLSHDLCATNCPDVLQCYGIALTKENATCIHKEFQKLHSDQSFLSRFVMDYRHIRVIGSGTFGCVYEAEHIIDKQKYAVKCVAFSKNDIERVRREVEIIAALLHDNIVRYHTCWIEGEPPSCQVSDSSEETSDLFKMLGIKRLSHTKSSVSSSGDEVVMFESQEDHLSSTSQEDVPMKCLFIQMELCQENNNGLSCIAFHDLIFTPEKFSFPLMNMFFQIIDAVACMHSHGIMHRDLKPQNIFFARDGYTIKVGDFGLAKQVNCSADQLCKHTGPIGTFSFMSPEVVNAEPYDKSTDIYSLGLIALIMFYPLVSIEVLEKAKEEETLPFAEDGEKYKLFSHMLPLIKKMLKHKPKERPTAEEIKDFVDNSSAH